MRLGLFVTSSLLVLSLGVAMAQDAVGGLNRIIEPMSPSVAAPVRPARTFVVSAQVGTKHECVKALSASGMPSIHHAAGALKLLSTWKGYKVELLNALDGLPSVQGAGTFQRASALAPTRSMRRDLGKSDHRHRWPILGGSAAPGAAASAAAAAAPGTTAPAAPGTTAHGAAGVATAHGGSPAGVGHGGGAK